MTVDNQSINYTTSEFLCTIIIQPKFEWFGNNADSERTLALCDFCYNSAVKGVCGYRHRTVASVMDEIRSKATRHIMFIDDNFIGDPSFTRELLEEINALGIGPQGFGGRATALAVHIETLPTHIAGLPCAVNINCHVARHVTEVL